MLRLWERGAFPLVVKDQAAALVELADWATALRLSHQPGELFLARVRLHRRAHHHPVEVGVTLPGLDKDLCVEVALHTDAPRAKSDAEIAGDEARSYLVARAERCEGIVQRAWGGISAPECWQCVSIECVRFFAGCRELERHAGAARVDDERNHGG